MLARVCHDASVKSHYRSTANVVCLRPPCQWPALPSRTVPPKARPCRDRACLPPRADYPDRPGLLHDDLFALNVSAPHPVATLLVVGPDDVRDVGVGNQRYDTVAPSLNGVASEVDGGHSRSSSGPRFRLRAVPSPSAVQAIHPGRLYGHPEARLGEPRKVTSSGNVTRPCPTLATR